LGRHAPLVPLRRRVQGFDALVDTTRAQALIGFEAQHSIHQPETYSPAGLTSEDFQDA